LAWLAAPEPFVDFMGTLFHGVDFKHLPANCSRDGPFCIPPSCL